jgi:hypothetical protein
MMAEYGWAFAHSIDFEQFCLVWAGAYGDAINVSDVEMLYKEFGGRGGWGWLDDDERWWIKEFKRKVREGQQARENHRSS